MSLEFYKKRLQIARAVYNKELGVQQNIQNSLIKAKSDCDNSVSLRLTQSKILTLLESLSNMARQQAKEFLENIVTTAIKYVSENDYNFVIDFTTKSNKPFAEFYIVETINGRKSIQKPEDACGGGFLDIISSALRYAYLEILQEPVINGALLFDEPCKMISEDSAVKYGTFVHQLTHSFNRQTIMITHNTEFINVADKTWMIVKNEQTGSQVQLPANFNNGLDDFYYKNNM